MPRKQSIWYTNDFPVGPVLKSTDALPFTNALPSTCKNVVEIRFIHFQIIKMYWFIAVH